MGLKQGYALSLFFNFALEYTILGSPWFRLIKVYINKSYRMLIYVNICFLLRMVWNKDMLNQHCFILEHVVRKDA
jgi:hypothetical protein